MCGYLVRLTELELIDRERRMVERRIRMAKFPAVKSLDSFDFKAMPSLNKMMVLELARCEYIERRENVIALGNSGTGKTHIALGLGLAACQKGLTVGFITAAALVHELIEARDEKRLLRFQKQLAKYKLLIIDELGFVPLRDRPETLCRITEFSEHSSRMDASLMKASALRLRFSQSLASRRQRLSQAMVRSTTQRLGWTTKPFTRSDRLTISVSRSGRMPARAR